MTPIEITPACVVLAAGTLVTLAAWLLKAGDRWRRTGRCGRTGRMRWATR